MTLSLADQKKKAALYQTVWDMHKQGRPTREIVALTGLSRGRVSQIILGIKRRPQKWIELGVAL